MRQKGVAPIAVIVTIIALITMAGVAYYYFIQPRPFKGVGIIPAPSLIPTPSSSLPTSPTDTSDQSIKQDLDTVDNNLNSFDNDVSSVNQGLNDQPDLSQ